MPRSMWRGAIQFGLVTIPVRLYLATESRGGLSFNLLHAEDERRIQMKIHCPEHGEIPRSETVRGYEWSKGHYVVIDESDLEAVPLKTVRSIEIEQFVPARRDGQRGRLRQAVVLPRARGRRSQGLRLLRTVLADSELQAVCKIVLKDREQLAALDPFGPTMLLSTLYWPDEVRDVGELEPAAARGRGQARRAGHGPSARRRPDRGLRRRPVPRRVPRGPPQGHRGQGRGPAHRGPRADRRDEQAHRPHGHPRGERGGRSRRGCARECRRGQGRADARRRPLRPASRSSSTDEPVSVAEARKARAHRGTAAGPDGRAAARKGSGGSTKPRRHAAEPATASRGTSRRRKSA